MLKQKILLATCFCCIFYFAVVGCANADVVCNAPSGNHCYYVSDADGNDANDGTTVETAKKTIQAGITLMSSGDILIIRNGTYTGDANMINWEYRPPDGTQEKYTVIKGESAGGVTIDGESVRNPLSLEHAPVGSSYLIFDSLGFVHGLAGAEGNVRIGYGNHIKILNCFSSDAASGAHGFSSYYSSYVLYEDCWAWGHMQYAFHFRDNDHSIVRRCVARIDRAEAGDAYISSFFNYNSTHTEWQNCLVIDQNQEAYLDDNVNGAGGVFAMHLGNNGSTNNVDVNYRGCMVLNTWSYNGGLLTSDQVASVTVNDMVVWGLNNQNNIYNRNALTPETEYDHVVVGGNNHESGRGIYTSGATENTVTNSIVIGMNVSGLWNIANASNNCLYGNASNLTSTTCPTCIVDVNPLDGSLEYLPRIESGSVLSSAGLEGTYVGANITKKIGVSGTLWGETGYDIETEENLWPFSNEDLIKEKMAQYSYDDPNDSLEPITGARGFAASGNGLYGGPITLTSYIWEYLENPCPEDVCSYGNPGDTTAPGAPSGLNVQ